MYDQTDFNEATTPSHQRQGIISIQDLTIDDNLTDLERLKKYVHSAIEAQRYAHVKLIHDLAVSIGFELAKQEIFPLFEKVADDNEEVILSQFAEELTKIAESFLPNFTNNDHEFNPKDLKNKSNRNGNSSSDLEYKFLLDSLLDNVKVLLQVEDAEVRSRACIALATIARFAKEDDILAKVLPIALLLVHNQENVTMRVTGVEALRLLSQILLNNSNDNLKEFCRQFIVPEVMALAEDEVYQVRRELSLSLPMVIKGSPDALLTIYYTLSRDPIWGVRKVCASVLPLISKSFPVFDREQFIPLAEEFSNDSCRWVRDEARSMLGSFLAGLPAQQLPDKLLIAYGDADSTAVESIAAVVVASGHEKWPILKPLARRLAADSSWQVKTELIQGLKSMCPIIGVDETAKLLAMAREDRGVNWRLKLEIAEQLPDLLALFPVSSAWTVIAPLCFDLLDDPVKLVGKTAMRSLGPLLNKFAGDRYKQISQSLLDRRDRKKYGFDIRQQFVGIVSAIQFDLPEHQFMIEFLPPLLELVDDPVPNVRVALAETLSQPRFMKMSPSVKIAVATLAADTDIDVVQATWNNTYPKEHNHL